MEVGTPMVAKQPRGPRLWDIAVSQDGKLIVTVSSTGQVTVWNVETRLAVNDFKGSPGIINVVDISLDATKIATGSQDGIASVWSLSTGERLLGPFKHDNSLAAVKFSPNAYLIATATQECNSVRIYDNQDGHLLSNFPIHTSSNFNDSIAWKLDSKQLFVLSSDGDIYCFDVSTGQRYSKWAIHSDHLPRCLSLASNGAFIAASAYSSISFWDTATCKQIGPVIRYPHDVWFMSISTNYDIAIGVDKKIYLRDLCDILPPPYSDNVSMLPSEV